MANQLQIGDKVSFLKETGQGLILEIQKHQVRVKDESGFEYWYPIGELVPFMSVSETDLFQSQHSKAEDLMEQIPAQNTSKNDEWKIDLHMENLVDSHGHMSNHEIVLTQLKHFKQFLERAEKAKVGKMLIVHGQGTGKLKAEIRLIVNDIKGAQMYDADYQKNGLGASVIERRYNVR